MARTSNAEKRAEWESRLRRYRGSGLSIGGFCTRESVSVASFYYWSRRLRGHNSRATASRAAAPSATERPLGDDTDVVRFHLPAGAEIVVPATRLDVVRCVAECLTRATSVAGPAFREVVVKPR